jgi:hypothetical protein
MFTSRGNKTDWFGFVNNVFRLAVTGQYMVINLEEFDTDWRFVFHGYQGSSAPCGENEG